MTAPSLLISPDRYKAGKLYSQLPQSGAGDFSVVRNTVANRVNDAGVLVSEAANVPRIDFGVSSCPALLVEPAATNQIRNNTGAGAVAGTPGTLPTNWTNSGSSLSRQVVGAGVTNGIDWVDVRIFGTATSTFHDVFFEPVTQIIAAQGQQWTNSVYLQVIAQPQPPASYGLAIREFTAAAGFLTIEPVSRAVTTTMQRFSQTRTLANASTGRVQPSVHFTLVNGASYDFTIRIGLPQMELGAVATSAIRTSGTIQTRNADSITLTSASGLIGQAQGTIYWDIALVNGVITGTGNPQFGVRNTAFTNWIGITSNTTANPFRITVRATTGPLIDYAANITSGKAAVAYSSAGAVLYVNGVQVGTSATNPNFSFDRFDIIGLMVFRANAAAIYTTRLSNAELAQLTTP